MPRQSLPEKKWHDVAIVLPPGVVAHIEEAEAEAHEEEQRRKEKKRRRKKKKAEEKAKAEEAADDASESEGAAEPGEWGA